MFLPKNLYKFYIFNVYAFSTPHFTKYKDEWLFKTMQ